MSSDAVLDIIVVFVVATPEINIVFTAWGLTLASIMLWYATVLARRRQVMVIDHLDLALGAFALMPLSLFRLSIFLINDYTLAVLGSRIGNFWTLAMLTIIVVRHYLILMHWQPDQLQSNG